MPDYDAFIADIDFYFQRQLDSHAFLDDYEYKALIGTEFEADTVRAAYFYRHYKPPGYKVDIPADNLYRIILRIDPCQNKRNPLCCMQSNLDVCEDNIVIVAGKDLPIAWFMSGFIVQCSVVYDKLGECGTYIEIHKPNDPFVVD